MISDISSSASQPRRFTFLPDEPVKSRKKRGGYRSWRAPEHFRLTRDIVYHHPFDSRGLPMRDKEKVIMIDKRPEILRTAVAV